jgi:hypothetical protein
MHPECFINHDTKKYIRWLLDIIKIEIFFPPIIMNERGPNPTRDESGDDYSLFDGATPAKI